MECFDRFMYNKMNFKEAPSWLTRNTPLNSNKML